MGTDQIDQAIAGSSPQHESRVRMEHTLPSGRALIIDVPTDLTLDEFRAINGWVAADMPRAMASAQPPASGVVAVKRPSLVVAR